MGLAFYFFWSASLRKQTARNSFLDVKVPRFSRHIMKPFASFCSAKSPKYFMIAGSTAGISANRDFEDVVAAEAYRSNLEMVINVQSREHSLQCPGDSQIAR